MYAEDLMTQPVHACHPGDTLDRAAGILWRYDCGVAPVVDEENHVLGMITDRDICMAAYTQGKSLVDLPVSRAMSDRVHTCGPRDTLDAVERVMKTNRVRRIPIVDAENHLLGLISLNDLAREAARERNKKRKEISDEEIGGTLAAVCTPWLPQASSSR